MGETGAGVKKYVVKLSAEERESLEAMIGGGKRSAQLSALLEGLDWMRVRGVRTAAPTAVS